MKLATFAAVAVVFALATSSVSAQCGTNDGRVLNMPSSAGIGTSVTITLDSPPPSMFAFLMFSLGQGPTDGGSYGPLCIDFPTVFSVLLDLDASGHAELDGDVPYDPNLIGLTLYAQFITCGSGKGSGTHGSSNQESITFTDTDCCRVADLISSNFNGTKIPANDYVWFNAVVDLKDLNSAAVVHFIDGMVTFTANGVSYNLDVPPAVITISDTATDASTDWDPDLEEWVTVVPSSYSGNLFLSGMGVQFPSGLPGSVNPVDWSGTFSSTVCGESFQWKWAAAVYKTFTDDPSQIGVKPIDGDKNNPYANSDHAGTPENYKSDVVGGARGGGGSDYTGSYSGTSTVGCQ